MTTVWQNKIKTGQFGNEDLPSSIVKDCFYRGFILCSAVCHLVVVGWSSCAPPLCPDCWNPWCVPFSLASVTQSHSGVCGQYLLYLHSKDSCHKAGAPILVVCRASASTTLIWDLCKQESVVPGHGGLQQLLYFPHRDFPVLLSF